VVAASTVVAAVVSTAAVVAASTVAVADAANPRLIARNPKARSASAGGLLA
jgi:hypothetical protein